MNVKRWSSMIVNWPFMYTTRSSRITLSSRLTELLFLKFSYVGPKKTSSLFCPLDFILLSNRYKHVLKPARRNVFSPERSRHESSFFPL